MRKAIVAEVLVVGVIVVGSALLGGLAVGDKQWQYYTDNRQCDDVHFIATYIPKIDKQDGSVSRVRFVVPCNEWFKRK